jgi:hypothetical protein
MLGSIPLHTEEQYLVPLVVILLVEYILVVTILYSLQKNNTIYKGFNDGKNFTNNINSHGGYGGAILLCVLRFLLFILFFCIIGYHYAYQPFKLGLQNGKWSNYTQWCLFLVTFYFLIVTTLSIRKLRLNNDFSTKSPLVDPKLTKFASSLFSLTGVVALVSSTISIYDNGLNIVIIDHIVLVSMIMEIFLNNFSVTASDMFHSFNFSFLYISVLFICVVLFDTMNWPHVFFGLRDRWCLARYNIFIFAHVAHFGVFYFLTNKMSGGTSRIFRKTNPKPVYLDMKPKEYQIMPIHESDHGDKEQLNELDADADDVESQRPKQRLIKTMDEELEEQYCPDNKDSFKGPPPPGAGDLTEEEEKELKHTVGKLSHKLQKQEEKYEKLKHKANEKDIKVAQLEADLEAKESRLKMLISQQKEVLDRRIEPPPEIVQEKPKRMKVAKRDSVEEGVKVGGVLSCPGCEKDYKVNDDMKLVEVETEGNDNKEEEDEDVKKSIEPFITDQVDKDYFRHVLLSEVTKDSRMRAKKLGIDLYYNKDVDDGKDKTLKLKKDLQNEIYKVCTGDLLYPTRDPETVKEKMKLKLLESREIDEDGEHMDTFRTADFDVSGREDVVVTPRDNGAPDDGIKRPKKIVLYRQKTLLKDTLQQENVDEIRERAMELGIDIYDDYGKLKLKKNLKAEIYGEMTGDSIYDDIHTMSRMDTRVLVSRE